MVFPLKDRIEAATGEKCWIDLDGIESDAQFVNVIMRAIDSADVFLFMFSKRHSEITNFETDWTVREISYAQKKQKRIVIVNLDNTPMGDWFEFMFSLKQQVDATSDQAIDRLTQDIRSWLKINTSPQISSAPQKPQPTAANTLDAQPKLSKKNKKWLGLGAGVLLLLAVIIVAVTVSSNNSSFPNELGGFALGESYSSVIENLESRGVTEKILSDTDVLLDVNYSQLFSSYVVKAYTDSTKIVSVAFPYSAPLTFVGEKWDYAAIMFYHDKVYNVSLFNYHEGEIKASEGKEWRDKYSNLYKQMQDAYSSYQRDSTCEEQSAHSTYVDGANKVLHVYYEEGDVPGLGQSRSVGVYLIDMAVEHVLCN